MGPPIDEARALLRSRQPCVVLTGAGMSAESGVPTFRGPGGLWRDRRPEELATPEAFARDPGGVWEWYDWRRQRIAAAVPHAGHVALAEYERRTGRTTILTQNVDGLHERAGSRRVVLLHGDIWTLRCTGCGTAAADLRPALPDLPPRCECGALMRPGVVWFGEPLPAAAWAAAEGAVRSCGVLVVVGTAAVVYPAAGLIGLAARHGAAVIEVNPEETPFSDAVDVVVRGAAGRVMPALLEP